MLAITLNPDGTFTDDERALRRGFLWCGRQGPNGMSVGKLVANPQLRAELDAWFAKFGAPGMCNPADHTPTVTGEPTPEVVDRDTRSHALHFMLSLQEMGTPDPSVTANTALYSVFKQADGRKTYLAYNAGKAPLEVAFSDGKKLSVAPGKLARAQ